MRSNRVYERKPTLSAFSVFCAGITVGLILAIGMLKFAQYVIVPMLSTAPIVHPQVRCAPGWLPHHEGVCVREKFDWI